VGWGTNDLENQFESRNLGTTITLLTQIAIKSEMIKRIH
jgi:hypothetical protein